MADDALAPTDDPFDQIDPQKVGLIAAPKEEPAPAPPANDNQDKDDPFAGLGEVGASPDTAAGAFRRGAEKSALPAAVSLAGAGAGGAGVVAGAAALGTTIGPWGTLAGAVTGGLVAGYLGSAAQDWALKKLPDSWVEALGMDDRQERLDQQQHGTASFLGGLVPYAVTMKPGPLTAKLPENATALQKALAHPAVERVFGGALVGGMELGQEKLHGQVDWGNVAISTGFGVVFNRPNRLGQTIEGLGGRPFRRDAPTVAQAGDLKVMGPGVTEDVFQGAHEQAPEAAQTVQETARAERAAEPPEPDIHAIARQMNPELIDHYDRLRSARNVFEAAGAEEHRAAMDAQILEMTPEVAAAYRRAAETTGTTTIAPEPFPSFAAMLAAHERGGGNVQPETLRSVPEAPSLQPGGEVPGVQGIPPSGGTPANIEGQAGIAGPVAPSPQRSMGEQRALIAEDVARRLVAAGRPEDEAKAAGQLVAARYVTRSGRFGGKLGSPEELYLREGAAIGGAQGAPLGPRLPEPAEVWQQPEPTPPDRVAQLEEEARSTFGSTRARDDMADLRGMLERKASPEEIAENPIVKQAQEENRARPQTVDLPGYGTPEFKANREFDFDGEKVKGYDAAIDRLLTGAKAFSTKGPIKNEREATIVLGPPASGKSRLSETFASERGAAIVDSDEAKKVIPEYDAGRGTSAVHEESSHLIFGENGVFDKLLDEGANMVIPKVGHSAGSIQQIMAALKEEGYRVNLVNMNVKADEAYRRMIGRFLKTGRVIGSDYFGAVGDKPTKTYYKLRGDANESTDIDVNGPIGSEKFLDGAETSLAQNIRSRGSREPSNSRNLEAQAGAEETVSHAEPVQAALDAADRANDLSPAEQKRELPAYSPEAESAPKGPDQPAGVFMFDPTQLNVDAKRFQFKSGGDEYGVTGALRNVTKWDPAKAQSIIVWEQADGKLYVADGHQRAGLARRLTEKGGVHGIQLPGVLYREKDGISADDIRAIAAVTNIANGSGSAIDGAKVLRARPDLMDGSLPLSVGKGKQAAALARLGDEPFKMVVNDVIPENYGAVVGDLLPNDPARQEAAIKAIARFEPKNVDEAAVLTQRVAQAELAKREEGAQASMFGDLETPESTAGEEMKIVGRAIADLKKDRSLFSRVLANAERIEQTGSSIEREAAKGVASDAEIFAKTLSSEAYSAGPIRTELLAAAKDLKNGSATVGEASARIVSALRTQAETHGADRTGAVERGEAAKEYAQVDQSAVEAQREKVADLERAYLKARDAGSGEIHSMRAHPNFARLQELGAAERSAQQAWQLAKYELGDLEHQFEPGAEGKPQQLIPGVKPVTQRDLVQAAANKPMGPKVAQKPPPEGGLFGSARDQGELFQTARGKIRIAPDERPIITLMKHANASTFVHESGHAWLEELMRDAAHPDAPMDLRNDARIVREWLGTNKRPPAPEAGKIRFYHGTAYTDASEFVGKTFVTPHENYARNYHGGPNNVLYVDLTKQEAIDRGLWDEVNDRPIHGPIDDGASRLKPLDQAGELKTKHHEKFARGFEQYMREGVAPSPGLAGVFAKFRNWLLSIYQSIKGLGTEITPEVRGVFDRMLEMEPQRTVIAPERPSPTMLHDIHEAEAATVEPHEAEGTGDRIAAEIERYIQENPDAVRAQAAVEKIQQAEAEARGETAQPAGEAGEGAGPGGHVDEGGAGSEPQAGGGASGAQRGAVEPGGGAGVSEGGPAGPERRSKLGDNPGTALAPGPVDLFGGEQSPFTDRAGNIRLDTLNTTEDVRQAIRDSASENNDFIGDRRGVVTDGQVLELADALGMDAARLNQRKIGQAFNAEQIVAARKLLIESAGKVWEAMKKAATGTDEDVLAYATAKDRHRMIQANVAGITAEAGRALRAFRKLPGQEQVAQVDEMLKQATGKTLFQLKVEATMGAALDSPQKVSKFIDDAHNHSFGRMIMEYFVNSLISGPATHSTYMIGNMLLLAEKQLLVNPTAAAIGAVRAAFGNEGPRVHAGEAAAGARGAIRGIAPALEAVGASFKAGVTAQLPNEAAQATLPFQLGADTAVAPTINLNTTFGDLVGNVSAGLRSMRDGISSIGDMLKAGGVQGSPLVSARYSPLGHIPDIQVRGVTVPIVGQLGTLARLPSRTVAAIHTFFRVLNYSAEINQAAFRAAKDAGLEGDALAARAAELRQSPTQEMMDSAAHTATELTLMGQGGNFINKVSQLFNTEVNLPVLGTTQPLKFIDPFVKIAGNVVKQSVGTHTPLGLLDREIKADILGQNGKVAQDLAMAKMVVGSAIGMTFAGLAAEGYMSGSGPTDPHEAAMWRLAGNQAHSVRIGDIWYNVHRLGPLGALASVAADIYEVSHYAEQNDLQHAAAAFMHAFSQNFLDEGFLRGPSDLLKAIEDSGRYGGSYVKNFLSSFVPYSVGLSQINQDPYFRQTYSILDGIKAKVPGLSPTLFPRRDIWGEPMARPDAIGGRGVTAIYAQKMSHDPVNQAMLDLNIHPGPVAKKIRNVELTPQQYDDYARLAGRALKMRLDMIVRSPDFPTWPPETRHKVIEETIRQSREMAVGKLMHDYRDIPIKATEARRALARGEKPK